MHTKVAQLYAPLLLRRECKCQHAGKKQMQVSQQPCSLPHPPVKWTLLILGDSAVPISTVNLPLFSAPHPAIYFSRLGCLLSWKALAHPLTPGEAALLGTPRALLR